MNILILNSTSDLYGSSKILIYVLKALIKKGHNPVVVLSEEGPLIAELEQLNVKITIIRLGILRRKYFNLPGLFNRLSVSFKAWRSLSRVIKEEKIDHIYSNTTGVLIGAFLAKRKNIRHTWHVHEIITDPKFFSKMIGYLLKNYSDGIIVVSNAVKNHWKNFTGAEKITRIYNGIDCAPFENVNATLKRELNIDEKDVLIGMIGRVNHWKGQGYFLEIAKGLLSKDPSLKFVLAGDAYPGNEDLVVALENNIRNSGLSDCVHYIGFRKDIPNLIRSFDIFISPSILPDPFPTVILESMAASTPVVATRHGGAVEMVADKVTGILIPVNNAVAAAELILPLAKSEQMRIEMGKAGNQRIHNLFSHESFDRSIAAFF
ncbi:MAG: glycosyltransferase family 1 protein [Pedobacter sp.]|nr:MAG: glycosyltransferase family 1 protein [Pedobacter sp.]